MDKPWFADVFGGVFYWLWALGSLAVVLITYPAMQKAKSAEGRARLWERRKHRYSYDEESGEYRKINKHLTRNAGYTVVMVEPRKKRESKEIDFFSNYGLISVIVHSVSTIIALMWLPILFNTVRYASTFDGHIWPSFLILFDIMLLSAMANFFWQIYLFVSGRKYIVIDPPTQPNLNPHGPDVRDGPDTGTGRRRPKYEPNR